MLVMKSKQVTFWNNLGKRNQETIEYLVIGQRNRKIELNGDEKNYVNGIRKKGRTWKEKNYVWIVKIVKRGNKIKKNLGINSGIRKKLINLRIKSLSHSI